MRARTGLGLGPVPKQRVKVLVPVAWVRPDGVPLQRSGVLVEPHVPAALAEVTVHMGILFETILVRAARGSVGGVYCILVDFLIDRIIHLVLCFPVLAPVAAKLVIENGAHKILRKFPGVGSIEIGFLHMLRSILVGRSADSCG